MVYTNVLRFAKYASFTSIFIFVNLRGARKFTFEWRKGYVINVYRETVVREISPAKFEVFS